MWVRMRMGSVTRRRSYAPPRWRGEVREVEDAHHADVELVQQHQLRCIPLDVGSEPPRWQESQDHPHSCRGSCPGARRVAREQLRLGEVSHGVEEGLLLDRDRRPPPQSEHCCLIHHFVVLLRLMDSKKLGRSDQVRQDRLDDVDQPRHQPVRRRVGQDRRERSRARPSRRRPPSVCLSVW